MGISVEAIGDQFFRTWEVHAVEAGVGDGRGAYQKVDLCGVGLANHADQVFGGGSPDDGVVYDNDRVSLDDASYNVKFGSNFLLSGALARGDEGAANVVVPDEADFVVAVVPQVLVFLCVAECGGVAGVRDRKDDGSFEGFGLKDIRQWVLSCQLFSETPADFVDILTENAAVRAGEVDIFKDALAGFAACFSMEVITF